MSYLGSWIINDYITFACNTHSATTGAATDDDSSPTYRIYEDETGTAVANGTMSKLDDGNTTGFYSKRVQLTSPTFTKGKDYTVYIEATVGAVKGTISHQFQIDESVWDEMRSVHVTVGTFGEFYTFFSEIEDISPDMIADAVWDEAKSGHVIPDTYGDYLDDEITSRLAPTIEGNTLDVNSNGNAGIDWGNVDNNTSGVSLSMTTMASVLDVTNPVVAKVVAIGATGDYTNLSAITGANFEHFFRNHDILTTKIVDDVGTTGSLPSADVYAIADAVWDELRAGHLLSGSYGEFADWVLHKDTSRTFDRSTDSLEAIRDSMATGGTIPSVEAIVDGVWDELQSGHTLAGTFGKYLDQQISLTESNIRGVDSDSLKTLSDQIDAIALNVDGDAIAGAVWDSLRADHVIVGSFGEGVITYSLATQAKADVNEQVDIALTDIRLNELLFLANTAKPTKDSYLDLIMNKNADQTFDRTTDSLEAITDTMFKVTSIIDGTIDVQNILKRIHALVSGNGSYRSGDIFTFKDNGGNNYIQQTITDTEVVTALV